MNALPGFGKVRNRWFNLTNKKVLITVIFPIGVRYLLFHIFMSSLISNIFALKFKSIISERSTEKVNPKRSNCVQPHWNKLFFNLSLQCFFFPVHTNLFLSLLTFKPEIEQRISNILSAASKEEHESSKNRVVSSAYWIILNYCPFILIPLSQHIEKLRYTVPDLREYTNKEKWDHLVYNLILC